MSIQEESENGWSYIEKTKELISASQDAFDELVKALKEPLKLDGMLSEKMRVAVQAKKMSLVDAKEILQIMQDLERMIGVDNGKIDLKEKGVFTGGAPEARFKNVRKKR